MMPSYDVITFADTAVDLLMSGRDVTPQFGQVEKLVERYTLDLGGSCCLFAAQAAKLGLRTAVLGRVGADDFGRLVIDKLESAGVDTRYLTVDPALTTGLTVHLTPEGTGDRAMLTYLGSLSALVPADVTDDFLRSARHLHIASYYLHTGLLSHWVAIVSRARAFGLTISLDTNWDPSAGWGGALNDVLSQVDIFMPNDQEARAITGEDTLEAAVSALRERVPVVALKLGASGARLYSHDGVYACTPAPASAGGDSTGAGDSFDAGLIAGWLSHLPPDTALAVACACGRSVAGRVGGYAGQLWRDDVPALNPAGSA